MPVNEPILEFKRGSPERIAVEKQIKAYRSTPTEIPLLIGGKEIHTATKKQAVIPHEHKHVLANYSVATEDHIHEAIEASMKAKERWEAVPLAERISIFGRAADMLATTHRAKILAATMLNQSKNFFQAEIDASCELIDFWRFNNYFAAELEHTQPISSTGVWNRLQYRPLEGFVYAITPFNFTAIGGNLVGTPALMGNTVLWKPSEYSMLSNWVTLQVMREAGLPDGVVNFVPGAPEMITDIALSHKDLGGIHYTGSTAVFQKLWAKVGQNITKYRGYPRIVGETGGKGFIFAHNSANVPALATAIIRGAFEFAGQKCSAASRAYVPESIWPSLKATLLEKMRDVKMGSPENVETLVSPVIHKASWEKCVSYIEHAKQSKDCEIITGGKADDSVGYFVEPTIVVTSNPQQKLICEEIFGPIMTIHVYKDDAFVETLKACDSSVYALTGSIFAKDKEAQLVADKYLRNAAGNFYVNDKPTGAVVGQQPFGGARASGTNDKAGSAFNLVRWTSVRTVKETFVPPTEVLYPYMREHNIGF